MSEATSVPPAAPSAVSEVLLTIDGPVAPDDEVSAASSVTGAASTEVPASGAGSDESDEVELTWTAGASEPLVLAILAIGSKK